MDSSDLDRVVLVGNQKGGVLKSSVVAGVSSMVASAKRRVLVVDVDPQGNVSRNDLGVAGDRGRGLSMTLQYGEPLRPVQDVRPGLDVVPGGALLSTVSAIAATAEAEGVDMAANFRQALAELCRVRGYVLVLIDSAPGDAKLLELLLCTARYLVVPTADDQASLDGVELIAGRYLRARQQGANIELLGVLLANVNPRATARNRSVFRDITAMLGGSGADPFESVIRTDKAAALDMRARGLTPAELVQATEGSVKARIARLRTRGSDDATSPALPWSRDASGLAGDYQQLARELVNRIVQREHTLAGRA